MRAFDRDPIREGHYGQRPCEPHSKAGHIAASTNAAAATILDNPEPSLEPSRPRRGKCGESRSRTSFVTQPMLALACARKIALGEFEVQKTREIIERISTLSPPLCRRGPRFYAGLGGVGAKRGHEPARK